MANAQTVSNDVVYTEIAACRMTGDPRLTSILDFGTMPLTGVFPSSPSEDVPSGPVELVLSGGGLAQLRQSYRPDLLYGDRYGYRSGLNASMARHLRDVAFMLSRKRPTGSYDVVLDIGSNDGTLLSAYPYRGQCLIGMDPTAHKFRRFYPARVDYLPEPFSVKGYRSLTTRKASIVTSIAMLYDLERPLEFMRDVASILADDGLWHAEQSYLPAMLDQCAYDTICHEHLEYYGLTQLKWMADRADLRIIDVEQNAMNGGSLGVTFAHRRSSYAANDLTVEAMLQREAERKLDTPEAFRSFCEAVARHRVRLPAFVRELRAEGHVVFGYGASTKGNALLHACGLTAEDLPCVADVNPDKHGCVTPGTHIPIVSEAEAHALKPDYFLVLPWHFRDGIIEREQAFFRRGGKLIFPLPNICVVKS